MNKKVEKIWQMISYYKDKLLIKFAEVRIWVRIIFGHKKPSKE